MHSMIDLFAGCGGMTSGFASEGFDPQLAIEFDLHAAATYAANFGEDHTLYGDIATVKASAIPKADVVIGGPPCQGFSNLGSKDLNDPRNQLWREYLRVVKKANPKVFVIENVDRFMKSTEFQLLLAEADGGSLKNYQLSFGHLNAADFGVAQRRKRTIVIGSRIGKIELPHATHARNPEIAGLKKWVGTRSRIGRIPEKTTSTSLPESTVEVFGQVVPGTFKGLDIHLGRTPTPLSLERYDHIPPGGGRFDLPDHLLPRCWREKPTGTTDVMGRMRWTLPSHTIRTEFFKPEKGSYLHPQWDAAGKHRVNRPITHYEAARLQDFPEDFLWCGTKIQIAKQIGNAVPVGLARAIAQHLKQYL
ncbi:DNA cytosine methyltransferase [Rhodococcus sp. BH5]|uniref:DNA cytosine methyltransferase n=1 Tax=Rhodococcus sp. BH5 TaxID=2871702 RepID=UPI0022CDB589|nr:DNA cytosine methyltransferase [Rhodococcus sp. BH5]MCZ9633222.1 DNA cytosine methyltransferase [Rhodococcus sp. BH5]